MAVKPGDIHEHLKNRMHQRGVTFQEIEIVLNQGWKAQDVKRGMHGKVYVFPYDRTWEGKYFKEKEVTVYFKGEGQQLVLLTVKARYGSDFPTGGMKHENRV